MADSVCPLCGETVLAPLLKLHIHLEKALIREMREANPEWFSENGVCTRCLDEYKRKHERVREEARELRSKVEAYDQRIYDRDLESETEDDNY